MNKTDKVINYNFYHWGPFLYKTILQPKELIKIKNLCSKKSKDFRVTLAGLIKHEHVINPKKMFPIISPYVESYLKARYEHYNVGKPINNKVKLISSWVNYMTKFESNPVHNHSNDLSFVIYTKIPEELKQEVKDTVGNTLPGEINFIYTLGHDKYQVNSRKFMPEVGDFFIFPASLHHYVNHFQSDGERISISGNIKINNGEKV